MLLISSFFFFGRLIPQLDKTMPSRSVLANWVLRFGQVCKEREAKVGVCAYAAILRGVLQVICEAAEEYGVTLMTDMSSKMGQDGKKFQVN